VNVHIGNKETFPRAVFGSATDNSGLTSRAVVRCGGGGGGGGGGGAAPPGAGAGPGTGRGERLAIVA
jgi:hypothetical protein